MTNPKGSALVCFILKNNQMLKLKGKSRLKEKIKKILLRYFNTLEGNGNSNFKTNGEENFLNSLFEVYQSRDFCVFDVGANVGNYSELVLNNSKGRPLSIHAFEPTRGCFKELLSRFSGQKNIHLNNFGLSSSEKEATIYSDKEKSNLASLYKRDLKNYGISLGRTESISLKRLDTYIQENKISKVNLLKIDVEGHELEVLRGLGQYLNPDFIDFIQFEYGGCNLDSVTKLSDPYDVLAKNGFEICKIMPKYLEFRKYKIYMENFTYSNYVAVGPNFLSNEK